MKRTLSVLLVLILMFLLAACDTNSDRYQSAMRQIGWIPEETVEEPPVVIVPEDEEDDAEPKLPEPVWPEAVPRVEEFVEEIELTQAGDEFKARYTVTEQQLEAWETALDGAGFVGEPRVNEGLEVKYTTRDMKGYIELSITISSIDTTWPASFSEFPEFAATGTVVVFETYKEHSADVLHAVIKNESKQTVEAYIQALKRAGFVNLGYGYYTKTIDNVTYEFDGDQNAIWDVTTADLYWRVYPV